ncbi:hypothetical protein JCM10450v2_002645 [Rhodotorula kratochvilovae]
MVPRVFKRIRPRSKSTVTLPPPPDGEDIDRQNARNHAHLENWDGRRDETARAARRWHGKDVAALVDAHDHDFLENHAQDARLMKEFEDQEDIDAAGNWHETPRTKLLENSLWQNLVRERLKTYAEGMLPRPQDPDAVFDERNMLSRRRLERLETYVGETEFYLLMEKIGHRIWKLDKRLQAETPEGEDIAAMKEQIGEEDLLDELLLIRHGFRQNVHARLMTPPTLAGGRPLPPKPLTDEAVKRAYRDALEEIKGHGPDYHDLVDHYRLRSPAANGRYWALIFIHDITLDYQRSRGENPSRNVVRKHRVLVNMVAAEMTANPPKDRRTAQNMAREAEAKVRVMDSMALEHAYTPVRRAQSILRPPSVLGFPPAGPDAESLHSEDTGTDRSASPAPSESGSAILNEHSHNHAGSSRPRSAFNPESTIPPLSPLNRRATDLGGGAPREPEPGSPSFRPVQRSATTDMGFPNRFDGPRGPREVGEQEREAWMQRGRGRGGSSPPPLVPTHGALAALARARSTAIAPDAVPERVSSRRTDSQRVGPERQTSPFPRL